MDPILTEVLDAARELLAAVEAAEAADGETSAYGVFSAENDRFRAARDAADAAGYRGVAAAMSAPIDDDGGYDGWLAALGSAVEEAAVEEAEDPEEADDDEGGGEATPLPDFVQGAVARAQSAAPNGADAVADDEWAAAVEAAEIAKKQLDDPKITVVSATRLSWPGWGLAPRGDSPAACAARELFRRNTGPIRHYWRIGECIVNFAAAAFVRGGGTAAHAALWGAIQVQGPGGPGGLGGAGGTSTAVIPGAPRRNQRGGAAWFAAATAAVAALIAEAGENPDWTGAAQWAAEHAPEAVAAIATALAVAGWQVGPFRPNGGEDLGELVRATPGLGAALLRAAGYPAPEPEPEPPARSSGADNA